MDMQGQMIRGLLGSQGVDPRAQRAVAETAQFAQMNGQPGQDPASLRQYGNALADFLRQRGHNVNINDNLPQ